MRQLLGCILIWIALSAILGCGKSENLLIVNGQILKGGEALIPSYEEGEILQVGFIPVSENGQPARNWFVADVDQSTGTFATTGPLKKGMPPGKYRVAVELLVKKKDLFKDKFNGLDSPFVVEIENTSKKLMLDVEDPEGSSN